MIREKDHLKFINKNFILNRKPDKMNVKLVEGKKHFTRITQISSAHKVELL